MGVSAAIIRKLYCNIVLNVRKYIVALKKNGFGIGGRARSSSSVKFKIKQLGRQPFTSSSSSVKFKRAAAFAENAR